MSSTEGSNRQLTYQEIALPPLGHKVNGMVERLIMAEGRPVPLKEIALSIGGTEVSKEQISEEDARVVVGSLVKSQLSRFAHRLDRVGLCVVRVEDRSGARDERMNLDPESLAFALARKKELAMLGYEPVIESKPGFFICEVGHERFERMLDSEHRPVSMIIEPAKKKAEKKVEAPKLVRIEEIEDEALRKLMVGIVGQDSMLTQIYGRGITTVDDRGPLLDSQDLAPITLEALGLKMLVLNGRARARIVEVLEAGIFYERDDESIKRQKSNFNFAQTVAFIAFYNEFRWLFDEDSKRGNSLSLPQRIQQVKKKAREKIVAKIGKNHVLAEALTSKGVKESNEEEESF